MPLAAGLNAAADGRLIAGRARSNDCAPRRPRGSPIYQAIKDKAFFLGWISCGEAQLGLPTAVHESVHYITAELDAFPLVQGGAVEAAA